MYKFKNLDILLTFGTHKKNLIGGHNTGKLTENELNDIYNFPLLTINYNKDTNDSNLVRSTYGEVKYNSIESLIKELIITDQDVFYDLGSGTGKIVMQFFMNTPVKYAFGVEYFPERSYNAEIALKRLYKSHPEILDNNRIISYQIQNIKDIHYLDNATIVFLCSTCYPVELLGYVYEKLKDSDKIRYIITHKEYPDFARKLPNKKTIQLPCTWSNNLTWFIYST
jgi:hypothetical protein